jgi:prepilin-type processing-associated H-X9-DG protein
MYTAPHVGKTTNAMYLDGHAATFDFQYLHSLYLYYSNHVSGGAHQCDPTDPFHNQ